MLLSPGIPWEATKRYPRLNDPMLLQRQAPALRPLTTAHLAQTMTLLELSAVELRQKIDAALASNPALELVDARRCPSCRRPLPGSAPCPFCSQPHNLSADRPIVFVSSREEFYSPGRLVSSGSSGPDEYLEDHYETASSTEDLPQFVLRQIAPELDPADRPLAAHLLTSLDEDGLLTIPLAEVARYHHVPFSRVQAVLRLIQRAEPVGVASPSPQEALLIQLEVLAETRPVPPLAARAIQEGMDLISRRRFPELGRKLGVSSAQAREIARFISDNLNPFPGRAHWGDLASGRTSRVESEFRPYTTPDVIISRLTQAEDSPLVVEVALPLPGILRVNPLYRQAVQQAPENKSEQWQADLEQANLLVKCIQQRNHTIVRLMERLSIIQRQFILHGEAYLQPLTRAILAKELDVHESTISRAVSAKSVQLPNGHIVPLAMFFDRSLHIRTALKKIVSQEKRPLSDTEIGEILAEQGYSIARRTVAKYRAMEGILPAHLRKTAYAVRLDKNLASRTSHS